jgi:hypothetical protein
LTKVLYKQASICRALIHEGNAWVRPHR